MSRVAIMGIRAWPGYSQWSLPSRRIESSWVRKFSMKKPGLRWTTSSAASFKARSTSCKPEIGPSPLAQFAPMLERFTIREMRLVLTARETASAAFRYHARTFGAAKLGGVSQKRTSVPSVALERAAASSDEACRTISRSRNERGSFSGWRATIVKGFPANASRSISRRPMFPVGVVIVIMISLQGKNGAGRRPYLVPRPPAGCERPLGWPLTKKNRERSLGDSRYGFTASRARQPLAHQPPTAKPGQNATASRPPFCAAGLEPAEVASHVLPASECDRESATRTHVANPPAPAIAAGK